MIPKAYLKELLQVSAGRLDLMEPDNLLHILSAKEASEILKWIESLEAGDCRFNCRSKRNTVNRGAK